MIWHAGVKSSSYTYETWRSARSEERQQTPVNRQQLVGARIAHAIHRAHPAAAHHLEYFVASGDAATDLTRRVALRHQAIIAHNISDFGCGYM